MFLAEICIFLLSANFHPTIWPSNNISFSLVKCHSKYFCYIITLRMNPPEIRTTREQHFVPKLFASYCNRLGKHFKYLLNKIISNNTKCRKQILKFIWNTWKYFGEMTMMMKVYLCFHNFSELWNFIFSSSYGKFLFRTVIYGFSF